MHVETILVAVFLTALKVRAKATEECPYEWGQVGDSCFRLLESKEHYYRSVYEARQACLDAGGDIAAPTSKEIHEWLYEVMRNISIRHTRPEKVYIGVDDVHEEGNFVYTRNKIQVNLTYWGRDEPNNRDSGNEDCVLIESNDKNWVFGDQTTWKDYTCCRPVGVSEVLCQKDLDEPVKYRKEDDPLIEHCFKNIDDCESSSCVNNASCIDELMGYRCQCPEGYKGDKCQIGIKCPPVPVWRDVEFSSEENWIGSYVNYSCAEGFVLTDGSLAGESVCNVTGVWTPDFLDCIEPGRVNRLPRPRQVKTVEAPGAAALGTLGLIILSVEIGVMVLLDLTHLHSHAQILHRNVSHAWRRLSTRRTLRSRVSVNTISSCEDNTCNESIM